MTHDSHSRPPIGERRDHIDRRSENRADRRAHHRYTPVGRPPHQSDRRQGERRRAEH